MGQQSAQLQDRLALSPLADAEIQATCGRCAISQTSPSPEVCSPDCGLSSGSQTGTLPRLTDHFAQANTRSPSRSSSSEDGGKRGLCRRDWRLRDVCRFLRAVKRAERVRLKRTFCASTNLMRADAAIRAALRTRS